ncbi:MULTISPECIES: ISAs1 family transposase [unclassified Streptomyces]|uniref:ISAs1 family transposase n=1 Tax=unclassified Streptomyces TaxID=2593676 RepID=UPI001F5B62A6|nr:MULTISPECIES: ISAs1 family transposase [unclassified Streptomyces]
MCLRAVCGAKSIDELAEFGERATNSLLASLGVRRHLLSAVTHDRVATDCPGRSRCEDQRSAPLQTPAGTARPRRHRRHLRCPPLGEGQHHLAGRDEEGPLHRRHQDQPAHRLRPTRRPALDLDQGVQHTASATAHGRRESRSIKTCAIADNLGGIAFPHAHLAIRVHRRRKPTGRPEPRENVYAVTSLAAHQTRPIDLAAAIRGHWGIENSSHYIRDVTFAEDASTIHTGTAPRAMATIRTSPSAP